MGNGVIWVISGDIRHGMEHFMSILFMNPYDDIISCSEREIFESESLSHEIHVTKRAEGVAESGPSWMSWESGAINLHSN